MRHLQQNARAVAGVRLRTARAAVIQVQQYLQGVHDRLVGLASLDVDDESDTARLMLEGRMVKALRPGRLAAGPPNGFGNRRWSVHCLFAALRRGVWPGREPPEYSP